MLTICLIGGTGAVGSAVLQQLLQNQAVGKVHLIVRRHIDVPHDARNILHEVIIPDFEQLRDYQDQLQADIGICALGTTRGKAGTTGFVKVDHDYVLNFARILKGAGCRSFHLVSAANANKNSYFLYPKTKGEVEEEVQALKFQNLVIYRPGLLLTPRHESRPFEYFAQSLASVLDRWRKISIEVPKLAEVIVRRALEDPLPEEPSVTCLDHKDLVQLSGGA